MREGGCFTEVTTLFRKNSFHFPVHLFSERSQMTSKCDKKKKVAHEAQQNITDVIMF